LKEEKRTHNNHGLAAREGRKKSNAFDKIQAIGKKAGCLKSGLWDNTTKKD